jgi:NTP pyrophosphatase (non-canonical NTP hydrolase)
MGSSPERPDPSLSEIDERLRQFRDTRDWAQFHSPNRLAAALSIEAAEVLEHFLWVTDIEADAVAESKRSDIAGELADVFIYLFYLADRIGADLREAVELKINENEERFPVQ